VARLSEHPNIIGMKESGGDIAQIAELVSSTPPDFQVLAGSSSTFYAARCVGVVGSILALAAVVPEPCLRLFELTRERRHEEALALQHQLLPLSRLLSAHGVAGYKAALGLVGIDVGVPRPPLIPVSDTAIAALKATLARFQEVHA
jgi:4-hydroxy-2-oxoglutarate aldolase